MVRRPRRLHRCDQRFGALLATRPTGSGKSTSLYAALAELNRPEINVITVEDPVEYRLVGIEQIQINNRAGPHLLVRGVRERHALAVE